MKKGKHTLVLIALLSFCFTDMISQTWSPVGMGITGPYPSVSALCVYNGELYAAGGFTAAGSILASNIAKWNGTTWSSLSTGTDYSILSLAVYNGELYAAGSFYMAGGISADRIAKWDGTNWHPVGSGLTHSSGTLVVLVNALCVYNGELYAGGNFDEAGGINANHIAKWNGTSWSAVGAGVNATVNALTIYNGKLYVGGQFNSAGGSPANQIARWDGLNWSSPGAGVSAIFSGVESFTVFGNKLIIGGPQIAGGVPVSGIASWNDVVYDSLGTRYYMGGPFSYNYVLALSEYHNNLYAGGQISALGGNHIANIGKWDGMNWNSPGSGIPGNIYVNSLAVYHDSLFVGGSFTQAGSIYVNNIAKWHDGAVGIDELLTNYGISVYPNPAEGEFVIEINNQHTYINEYSLYDILGKQITNQQVPLHIKQFTIDLRGHSKGIYFLKMQVAENVIVKKIVHN